MIGDSLVRGPHWDDLNKVFRRDETPAPNRITREKEKARGRRRIIVTHEFMRRILIGESHLPESGDGEGVEVSSNVPEDLRILDIVKLDSDHLFGPQFSILCDSSKWGLQNDTVPVFVPSYSVMRIADYEAEDLSRKAP